MADDEEADPFWEEIRASLHQRQFLKASASVQVNDIRWKALSASVATYEDGVYFQLVCVGYGPIQLRQSPDRRTIRSNLVHPVFCRSIKYGEQGDSIQQHLPSFMTTVKREFLRFAKSVRPLWGLSNPTLFALPEGPPSPGPSLEFMRDTPSKTLFPSPLYLVVGTTTNVLLGRRRLPMRV